MIVTIVWDGEMSAFSLMLTFNHLGELLRSTHHVLTAWDNWLKLGHRHCIAFKVLWNLKRRSLRKKVNHEL